MESQKEGRKPPMNYILLTILAALIIIGFIQYKRSKETVTEVEPQRPEPERHSAAKLMKASQISTFWSKQCSKIYKELHQ